MLVKKEPVSHQTFIKSALEAVNLGARVLAAITRPARSLSNHGVRQTVTSAVIL